MRFERAMPFKGEVVWLTPMQGGRTSGPPPTPADQDYAATAYVQSSTLADGLASFVLRVTNRTAWRSEALGAWLIVENEGVHRIDEGSIVVITEGSRPVAHFRVRQVIDHPDAASPSAHC